MVLIYHENFKTFSCFMNAPARELETFNVNMKIPLYYFTTAVDHEKALNHKTFNQNYEFMKPVKQ